MPPTRSLILALCLTVSPAVGFAQTDCRTYAVQQTGFDPARPPPPPATANPQVAGSGTRARGAMAGAAIGSMSGDAGRGAAAGAVAGGVTQRSRNRRATRAHNDAMAQHQQAGRAAYDQAYSACMAHGR